MCAALKREQLKSRNMDSLLDNKVVPTLRNVASSSAAFLRQEVAFYLNVRPHTSELFFRTNLRPVT